MVSTAGQKHAGSKPVICVETASPGTKTRPQHSRLEQKNKFASPKSVELQKRQNKKSLKSSMLISGLLVVVVGRWVGRLLFELGVGGRDG